MGASYNTWTIPEIVWIIKKNLCSNLLGSLQYITSCNTYWNINTVPVACVEICTTVCATLEILLAGPTLLWAGIDTPSQGSDRGC